MGCRVEIKEFLYVEVGFASCLLGYGHVMLFFAPVHAQACLVFGITILGGILIIIFAFVSNPFLHITTAQVRLINSSLQQNQNQESQSNKLKLFTFTMVTVYRCNRHLDKYHQQSSTGREASLMSH